MGASLDVARSRRDANERFETHAVTTPGEQSPGQVLTVADGRWTWWTVAVWAETPSFAQAIGPAAIPDGPLSDRHAWGQHSHVRKPDELVALSATNQVRPARRGARMAKPRRENTGSMDR